MDSLVDLRIDFTLVFLGAMATFSNLNRIWLLAVFVSIWTKKPNF